MRPPAGRHRAAALVAAAVLAGAAGAAVAGSRAIRAELISLAASRIAAGLARNAVLGSDLTPLPAGRPAVYLVVGTDSREALPAGFGVGGDISGQRADTVVLCALPPAGPNTGPDAGPDAGPSPGAGSVRLLSVPRDLRVRVPGHGDQKLAGAYQYGPRALLAAVRSSTGVGVQHYVEVDFAGLTRVVDLLGGVQLDLPFPARDTVSGLSLAAGRQRLDGRSALAFVRARDYQERSGGRWTYVEASDLGRIGRQHQFLAALLAATRGRVDVAVLRRAAAEAGRHISVDAGFGGADVRHWLAVLGAPRAGLVASTLPTRPAVPDAEADSPFPPRHAGSVGYLVRQEPQAGQALARLTTPDGAG